MDLSHIDLSNPDNFVEATPHEWLEQLRNEDPVHWHDETNGSGFWCITKWEDLRFVSRSPQIFSSQRGGTQMIDPRPEEREKFAQQREMLPLMLMMDPPKHGKFRSIVQKSFTPRYVQTLEPHIRALSKEIVDRVADRGECDFVEEVAAELPLQVICDMMGVLDEDRKEIFRFTNEMIGFDDPELGDREREHTQQAAAGMFAKAMKTAALYRDNPEENLTSYLLHREVDGEKLSDMEYSAFFLLLCAAGNETTRTVTTHGMRLLIEHPDQLQLLVDDPSLIPSAVEEMVRYEPAVHHFRRTATRDVEIRDRKIRADDKVIIWYPSANRDEEVFSDPNRFDVTRRENEHLAFGIGEHYCLGANLARLELNSIFNEVVPRLRDPELAGPVRRLRSNFVNGVKEMRISFTPESA